MRFWKNTSRVKRRNQFLLAISFFSGMAIMAMEISAARLLAPYFGTSIFVWTNVIGIVLVALSFGYYLGGKMADKRPELNALLKPMLAAGCIFLVIPWIVKPVATLVTVSSGVATSLMVIFVGSFAVTLLLFAFPIVLLGVVSPYVIKLYKVPSDRVGQMAGSVFAVSTLGSILGTFLPTLIFIPLIGTRATVTLFASILVALAIVGLSRGKMRWELFSVVLLPVIFWPSVGISGNSEVIFEDESVYQYIFVDEAENGTRYLRLNEGTGIQSVYHPDRVVTGHYYDAFGLLPALFEGEVDVAIIGLAGGSISRQLSALYEDRVKIDGVEIDGQVIEAARSYMELDQDQLQIIEQDGRMFVAQSEDTYDIIVVDAYAQQFYIPWTLVTKEFWEDAQGNLTERGVVAVNINASGDDAPLLTTLLNTMSGVFDYVYVARAGNNQTWNYMVIAGNEERDVSLLHDFPEELEEVAEYYFDDIERVTHRSEDRVFTDDWAPVEMMTDKMFFRYLLGL